MEWNRRFQEGNGRQFSILSYQFHTRFCALYLQKNTYRCRVVINNIVTEVFNFNIYAYYFDDKSRYFGCVHCANSVRIASLQFNCFALIALITLQFNCSIDATVDDLDKFD